MELQQLRYFVSIYNNKNLTKAAEECFLSVQGISASMHRLETELGEKLFARTQKGIIPTEHAEYLYPRAKRMLAARDECLDFFSAHRRSGATCRISLAQGTIEEYAGPVLKQYKSLWPDLHLAIHEASDKQCEDDILYGISELAIVASPFDPETYDHIHLLSIRHALITPRDGPLADREHVRIADLKGVPLCILSKENRTNSSLITLCEREGFRPEVVFTAEYVLAMFAIVENGLCSGITTESLARRLAREQVRTVPIDNENYLWSIYLIKSKNKRLSEPAERMWELMKSAVNSGEDTRPA